MVDWRIHVMAAEFLTPRLVDTLLPFSSMNKPIVLYTLALGAILVARADITQSADSKTATNAAAATTQPYGKKADKHFGERLAGAEAGQNATPVFTPLPPAIPGAPASPATRRIGDQPFDGPPFPTGDWQIGGGPNVIGDPGALRDNPFPLMQAIYDGPNGKAWYESRIQLYGWETVGANFSSSHNTALGPNANFPEIYDERSNHIEQDQFVLYLERMADQNQTDHIDWGFRLSAVYGLDYRFMISRGFLSNQLLKDNKYSGVDLPMMYGNLYIPHVAQGLQLIVGRIISLPDIEQQLAPNNLMASHSILYSFDDYTLWGVWTTTKLNANWILQVGLAAGVDVAPWQRDPGRQATGSVLLQYIASGGRDSWYGGMNSFNNGKFGYNNLQEAIFSYTHKFDETWWTSFEAQYMYMNACTTEPTAAVPYQNGFFPLHPGFVAEGGLLNYTMRRMAPNTFLTFRNEFYNDSGGARTGYRTTYYEGSVGTTWWPNKLICVRPELRYDHAFKAAPYNNGTRRSQTTLACDATYHF
jgi:hypothetical protein